MSTPTQTSDPAALVTLTTNALRLVKAAEDKLAKAPVPVPRADLEKVAKVLTECGFIEPGQEKYAADYLADPRAAIDTMINLAQKAAAALLRADPRLDNGTSVAKAAAAHPAPTTKEAGDTDSPADRAWYARMNAYQAPTPN